MGWVEILSAKKECEVGQHEEGRDVWPLGCPRLLIQALVRRLPASTFLMLKGGKNILHLRVWVVGERRLIVVMAFRFTAV